MKNANLSYAMQRLNMGKRNNFFNVYGTDESEYCQRRLKNTQNSFNIIKNKVDVGSHGRTLSGTAEPAVRIFGANREVTYENAKDQLKLYLGMIYTPTSPFWLMGYESGTGRSGESH